MRNDNEAQHIWFSSDIHLLHPKIVRCYNRPVAVEEHDEWIINRINSRIDKKDIFYILGDVSLGNRINTEKLLSKINGIKYLIPGNHDNNILNSTYFEHIYPYIYDFNFNSISYPNIHIVLCHFPLARWNRQEHGSMHLYGHTHNTYLNTGLSFDIGLDANNWIPINLQQVLDRFNCVIKK